MLPLPLRCGGSHQCDFSFVEQGNHVLMTGAAYEPTQEFCNALLKRMGVSTTYYDPMIGEGLKALVQPNTKVLFRIAELANNGSA